MKDKDIRESYYDEPCTVCRQKPSDPCHIKSYGSGGEDTEDNLIAMCRLHHQMQHLQGWPMMCAKFPNLFLALESKGWEFSFLGNRKKLVRK